MRTKIPLLILLFQSFTAVAEAPQQIAPMYFTVQESPKKQKIKDPIDGGLDFLGVAKENRPGLVVSLALPMTAIAGVTDGCLWIMKRDVVRDLKGLEGQVGVEARRASLGRELKGLRKTMVRTSLLTAGLAALSAYGLVKSDGGDESPVVSPRVEKKVGGTGESLEAKKIRKALGVEDSRK